MEREETMNEGRIELRKKIGMKAKMKENRKEENEKKIHGNERKTKTSIK